MSDEIHNKASEASKVFVREGLAKSQIRRMLEVIRRNRMEGFERFIKGQYARGLISPSATQYLLSLANYAKTPKDLMSILSHAHSLMDYHILEPLLANWDEISAMIGGVDLDSIRSVRVTTRGSRYVGLLISVDRNIYLDAKKFAEVYGKVLSRHMNRNFRVSVRVIRGG